MSILYKEEVFKIVGACFAVYDDKGPGFVEPVYQDCMEIELEHLGIPFESQKELEITYRGKVLRHRYIPDILCYGKIVVQLKAVREIGSEHRAQVLNYLNATKLQLGLLVNFGHFPTLQWERIVLTARNPK